ncbi:MAG: hypothetical protein JWO62_271 [Acidimicrobiaceae bacterium]|nr:hypothetical protein [Acidimicrobiaceae bacterium]
MNPDDRSTIDDLAPSGDGPEPPPVPPRRSRLRRAAPAMLVAAGVVVVAVVVAAFVAVPYYAITPGSGLNVSTLISVPKPLDHQHLGGVLLTDVEVIQLHALSYLYYELDSGAQVVSSSQLVGNASNAQYERQGVIDMYNARQAATVVGLHELGYSVRAVPNGVIVYQLEAGSAAAHGLAIGDVVESVDGHAVRTIAGLVSRLGDYRPGTLVSLALRNLFTSARSSVRLRLGELRVEGSGSSATEICAGAGTDTSLQPLTVHGAPAECLGISPEQAYATVGLPFKVSISSDGIVGPSAGLAFTLGLIEKLDHQDLTAGLKVAATGTMSVTGQVGDVGGVAQKTIAVRDAGAAVFFVPPPEYKTALANAGPTLKVLSVATIGQAISDLEQLGGRLTPSSSSR